MILKKAYCTLSAIRRVFPISSTPTEAKKKLYLSLVVPILSHCAPVWHPCLIRDIIALERFQRRATKYVLNDYCSDYKTRLQKLSILPLMYRLELADIMFFISSVKSPGPNFNIMDFFTISSHSHSTRSVTCHKLVHRYTSSTVTGHSYFNRLPRLYNSLPPLNLNLSIQSLKRSILDIFIKNFSINFDPDNPHTFHYSCPCNNCSKCTIKSTFSLT